MLYCNGSVLPSSNESNVERKNVTVVKFYLHENDVSENENRTAVYTRKYTLLIIFIKKKKIKNRKNKIVPLN